MISAYRIFKGYAEFTGFNAQLLVGLARKRFILSILSGLSISYTVFLSAVMDSSRRETVTEATTPWCWA